MSSLTNQLGTMFKKKRKHSADRPSRAESCVLTDDYQSDVISNQRLKELAASANIPQDALIKMEHAQKMQLLKAFEKSQRYSFDDIMKLCSELQLSIGDDKTFISIENVTTARQLLQNCLLSEIKTFIEQNGILYFLKIISRKMFMLEEAFNKNRSSVSDHISYINECISCVHQVFSTDFGYKLLADTQSSTVSQLCIALMVLNEVYESKSVSESKSDVADVINIDQARYNILRILAPLPVYVDDTNKETLLSHVLRSLDFAAMVRHRSRFSSVVDCLTSLNPKVVNIALTFINTIVNNAGTDNHELQARIIMRNEILRAGMNRHLNHLRKLGENHDGIEKAFNNFEELQHDDLNELEQIFKERPDISTFNGCIQSFGQFENDLVGILQILALACEGVQSRKLYLRHAERVLRHCLFGIPEHAETLSSLRDGILTCDAVAETLQPPLLALPKVTGGPPPPPPFPNTLPKVTGGPPPPPPPGGTLLAKVGGGPPAPPPPPLLGGPKGPPPPPMGLLNSKKNAPPPPNIGSFLPPLPPHLKEKKDIFSDKPMRKLHWKDYVIPPIHIPEVSLWAEIDDREVCKPEVIAKIQDNFFQDKQSKPRSSSAESSKSKKMTKTFVIDDPTILRNGAIIFASFKLTCSQWVEAIYNVNLHILSASCIERVLKILPEVDVIQKLAECSEHDITEMDEAEKFFAVSAKIPALKARLNAILFRQTWKEKITVIREDISFLDAGISAFQSESLKTFLNLVLFVGNYMNRTSSSVAPVYAFKLTLLKTLNNIKGNETNYSLLHALLELMNNISHHSVLSTELDIIAKAANVDLLMTKEQMLSMQKETNITMKFIENFKPVNSNDKFAEKMADFFAVASNEISALLVQISNVDKRWETLQDYLATKKLSSYKMKDLFDDVVQFRSCYNEIRIQHQKKREQQEKETAAVAARVPLKCIQTPVVQLPTADGRGFLDSMLENINKGYYRSDGKKTPRQSRTPDTAIDSRRVRRSKIFNDNDGRERTNIEESKNKDGYRVRQIGRPTVFVPPTTDENSYQLSNTSNSNNSGPPPTATLLDELKNL